MTLVLPIALLSLAAWLYLLFAHGDFWRGRERDPADAPPPQTPANGWPDVVAILPARNEADVVAFSIGSLLRQNYEGSLQVILVDDQSGDGTARVAEAAAELAGCRDRLTVLQGRDLPPGWTGKLWALSQGVDHAEDLGKPPEFLLLSDADIGYAADSLSRQVALAHSGGYSLVSRMAKLRCENLAERALIPAFIFFFQMLFPFAWVNRPDRRTAAAAGGCMLVRRQDLRQAGGIESIRDALIDDCALAARLKTRAPIRLELTERVVSLRPYPTLGEIRRMVARSAYAQLRYSPLLLLGTIAGMALIYVAPPALALFAEGAGRVLSILAWLAMVLAFQPTLRFYRLSPLWGLALPAIAAIYLLFTLDSAYQHGRGRGGMWKGRAQAPGSGAA
jgi:hopene-associated glycosyltransferase HpnB